MPYTNYRDMSEAIANREDFDGSSASGLTETSGKYVIKSYKTVMAIIDQNGQVEYYNDKHYSSTTSRLQNIIKRAYNIQ